MHQKFRISLRRGTRLIDIVAEDENPARAAMLANSLPKLFLHRAYEQNASAARMANEFLVREAEQLKAKLEASERKVQQYREEHQAVSLEDNQNITVEKLRDLNARVTAARGDRMKAEADLEELERNSDEGIDGMLRIGAVAAIPQVAEIRSQAVRARADFATLQKRYGPAHPKYIAAQSQITDLNRSLADAVRKARQTLEHQYQTSIEAEKKLGAALKEQEEKALALNKLAIPYNVLVREADADRVLYDNIVTRLKETGIAQAVDQAPYRVVEAAMADPTPIRPQRFRLLLLAAIGGCMLAMGLLLVCDLLDGTFRSVEEAEAMLGVPLLGAVAESRKGVRDIMVMEDPASPQAEAFRSLRTAIGIGDSEASRSIIAIASAVPFEGKSYVVLNLAGAFARQDLRTLLIDADLRRPQLSEVLLGANRVQAPGLGEYLAQRAIARQIIYATDAPNLHILPAGGRVPNPAELLGRPSFAKLLALLRKDFDRIVIDTAPVHVVSDTLSIAAHADGVCLVVCAGKTPARIAAAARRQLGNSGARVLGFVMNRIPKGQGSSYDYYSAIDGKPNDYTPGNYAGKTLNQQ